MVRQYGVGDAPLTTVNIHEAKTQLSRLIRAPEAGEDGVIARTGIPVVQLVALAGNVQLRKLGRLAGKISIPEEFDAPMPDEWLALFKRRN